MNVLYRNKEVYPQIDKPFRCIDIHNRKAYIALWVHPLHETVDLTTAFFGTNHILMPLSTSDHTHIIMINNPRLFPTHYRISQFMLVIHIYIPLSYLRKSSHFNEPFQRTSHN